MTRAGWFAVVVGAVLVAAGTATWPLDTYEPGALGRSFAPSLALIAAGAALSAAGGVLGLRSARAG